MKRLLCAALAVLLAALGLSVLNSAEASVAETVVEHETAVRTATSSDTSVAVQFIDPPAEGTVIQLVFGNSGNFTPTWPTGFTQRAHSDANAADLYVATKVAGASESDTFTVGISGTGSAAVLEGTVLTNIDTTTTDGVDETATANIGGTGATSLAVGPTATTDTAAEFVYGGVFVKDKTASGLSWTNAEVTNPLVGDAGNNGGKLGSGYREVAATGTYSDTASWTPTSRAAAALVTYRMTAVTPPGTTTSTTTAPTTTTIAEDNCDIHDLAGNLSGAATQGAFSWSVGDPCGTFRATETCATGQNAKGADGFDDIKVDPETINVPWLQFEGRQTGDDNATTRIQTRTVVNRFGSQWYQVNSFRPSDVARPLVIGEQSVSVDFRAHTWGITMPSVGAPEEMRLYIQWRVDSTFVGSCEAAIRVWDKDDPNVPGGAVLVDNGPHVGEHMDHEQTGWGESLVFNRYPGVDLDPNVDPATECDTSTIPHNHFVDADGKGQFRIEQIAGSGAPDPITADIWVFLDVDADDGVLELQFDWRQRALNVERSGELNQAGHDFSLVKDGAPTSKFSTVAGPVLWRVSGHFHEVTTYNDHEGDICRGEARVYTS